MTAKEFVCQNWVLEGHGFSPGGNLNTTKSGSNEVTAMFSTSNRNEALAVTSPFTPAGSPSKPLRNQNFGASVGGPIWRDHTFLFLLLGAEVRQRDQYGD